jgi:AcrR family transcriptional regulator
MKHYPKTVKGQENLGKIISNAIDLIAEKGFSGASVGEITLRAGVSHGLFYIYFNNKDELLVELIKRLNKEMRHYLNEKTSGIENRIEMEKAGFRAFFDWVYENRYFFQILVEAETNNKEIYEWHYRKLGERYSLGLREAMGKGEIVTMDPENLAFSLMGMSDFLARKFVLWETRKVDEEILETVDELLERILSPKMQT